MKKYIFHRGWVCAVLAVLAFSLSTVAQQTIINVPSTDILQKGSVYMEYGVSFKPNNQSGLRRFSSFVPRIVVGVGNNVEVGVNFLGNLQPGSGMKTISPTVKWRVYNNEKNQISATVGGSLFIPFSNRSYKIGAYSYAQISKTFGTGTRITTGGYYFTKNVVAEKASRGGGQFGIEQPITQRFGVMADWITGKHSAGYLSPGGYYRATKRITGYFGYSLGNQGLRSGNHYAYGAIGINLF